MLRRFAILSLFLAASCSFALDGSEHWVEVTSPHFTVITDSSDKQGRQILDQFERMRWLFQTLFPKSRVDPPLPIVVLAARDQKGFQALEPAAYLAKGQVALAGLFVSAPDRNYVLLRLDAEGEHPYAAIYHEYTHMQFRDAGGWMPLWLNEGLAEFIETTEIRNKDVLLGVPNADDIYYLRQHSLLPLTVLFKVDANSPYYHEEQKASVFYAEAWALTHLLEIADREKGTHRVQDYLALVRQHQDPVAAAQTAFGDLTQLQSALDHYIAASSYKQIMISSAAAPIDESSYTSTPLTQAQADANRADFLVYVQREPEARSLLDAVLKADPDNAQAHQTMGYLASRNGDLDAARKWYEEAAKLDSNSFLANYQFALLAMRSGNAANDPEVESSLRAAIRLNPDFAPAYDQLAGLFTMRHENLDEAHALNMHAIQLDPGSVAYRMNAVTVLMTMSRYADAASLLRSSLKVPGNPKEMAMLQSRLIEVESIEALGARPGAMITKPPTGQVDIQTADSVVDVVQPPRHPTEPPDGPKHTAFGVIRGVQCSSPAVIEFQLDTGKKPVSVYSNNFFKIDLTVLGFTPSGDMNPCKDFEGKKVRVQYAESSDKTVDGQVIAVELRK
jgi:tetratricopeptide (TPR) repeat protein